MTYTVAAVSLLLAVLSDGGPLSQRLASGSAMFGTALVALVLFTWRRAPDGFLLLTFPLAALTVTAVAVFDPPLALTPMYYAWPLMTAAYFLPTRLVAATYAMVCASFGATMLWAYHDGPRFMEFMTVVIVGAVVVAFVRALMQGIHELLVRLQTLAREDSLTGALNRRAFIERLEAELARADRAGEPCSVAILDVDHFKQINDRYGHAAGDTALRALVDTVSERLRRGDALGRLGGEEFAVLLSGTDAIGAEAYAEELRELVAQTAPFTVSIGVASAHDAGSGGRTSPPGESSHRREPAGRVVDVDTILAEADAALYSAKHAGRDTVRSAA